MSKSTDDIWHKWLTSRRDADFDECRRVSEQILRPIRDKVLDNASLEEGDTLLDVGCGDGLVAFGALERTQSGRVVFSDVSHDLLRHSKETAAGLGIVDRCSFVVLSAEKPLPLASRSLSIVTTRSVLIYVKHKAAAFKEFHRALEPGGRISLFEPINSFGYPPPERTFRGYDVTPVVQLAKKVKAVYQDAQPNKSDPMLNFTERDLFRDAEEAGFERIQLRLEAHRHPSETRTSWEWFYRHAPNPHAPTLEEALQRALNREEAESFLRHLKPLVEQGEGVRKMAAAYLWATKSEHG